MASGNGISASAVAVATAGGVLLYAGLTGVNPIEAIKQVASGKPQAVSTTGGGYGSTGTSTLTGGVAGSSAVGNALVSAAKTHANEKYSQARRWQSGYSDCSSFVGKSLKDVGIKPPGGSTTLEYRNWSKLTTVKSSEIQAGDLLCGTGHIAIAVSPTEAIGQQNGRVNVKIDKISNIMYGQVGWVPRRLTVSEGSG